MIEKELTYGGTIKQPLPEFETWEFFASYLLDNCEGETITEESLQRWLVESEKEREKRNNPHADIKSEYEKAIAKGKIVKVFAWAEYNENLDKWVEQKLPSWQENIKYKLRYYEIDWNKLLSESYANGEFVECEFSDCLKFSVVSYGRLLGYRKGVAPEFGKYQGVLRYSYCRLAKGVEIKDEWLKEIK